MHSLGLCAQLYIDLAWLRIVAHILPEAKLSNESRAEVCQQFLALAARLQRVRLTRNWIYSELLTALSSALGAFPLELIEREIETTQRLTLAQFRTGVGAKTGSLSVLAAFVKQRNAERTIEAFVRELLTAGSFGARRGETSYVGLAKLVSTEPEEFDVTLRAINSWAYDNENSQIGSPEEIWGILVQGCRTLERVSPMVIDLLARSQSMIYVPFVFAESIGVALPIEIDCDLFGPASRPAFEGLGDQLIAERPMVSGQFEEAVSNARESACALILCWERQPTITEFPVTVRMPILRLPEMSLGYDHGSIELPVALALFRARFRSTVRMNYAIMPTGPTASRFLKTKVEAFYTVGGSHTLLVATRDPIHSPVVSKVGKSVKFTSISQPRSLINSYLTPADWHLLTELHTNVVGVATDKNWNDPVREAKRSFRGRRLSPEGHLIRQEPQIADLKRALDDEGMVQVTGLSGIGKTYLLAQYLRRWSSSYKWVLYTSVPDTTDHLDALAVWAAKFPDELAVRLHDRCSIETLHRKLSSDSRIREDGVLLSEAFEESFEGLLAGERILVVIDDFQFLLTSENIISDSRFSALISSIASKWSHWCSVILVSTKRLLAPEILEYRVEEGFSSEEAREYLHACNWSQPDFTERVIRALGHHPRALASLVGHAGRYNIDRDELDQLLDELPDTDVSDERLRRDIGPKVLGWLLESLAKRDEAALWSLTAASTFQGKFRRDQLNKVLAVMAPEVHGKSKLPELNDQSLVSYASDERKWWIHTLLRNYLQDRLGRGLIVNGDSFRRSHLVAGKTFFPLTKTGEPIAVDPAPDLTSCVMALYHYDVAQWTRGQNAVLENLYTNVIPRVQSLIHMGQSARDIKLRAGEAEELLREFIRINSTGAPEDPTSFSVDVHRLMARALQLQMDVEKHDEALSHFHAAITLGDQGVTPFLVRLLCDMSEGKTVDDIHWQEAYSLFSAVRERLRQKYVGAGFDGLGEAYEAVARRLVTLGDPDNAINCIVEAADYGIPWWGLYLLAAEIVETPSDSMRWLEKGLTIMPTSSALWERYYLSKLNARQEHSVPAEWLPASRSEQEILVVVRQLCQSGEDDRALRLLEEIIPMRLEPQLCHALGRLYRNRAEEHPEERDQWFKKEEALYQSVIDIGASGRNGSIYIALGNVHKVTGAYREAEDDYKKAITVSPGDQSAYLALGRLYRFFAAEHPEEQDRWLLEEETVYLSPLGVELPTVALARGQLYEFWAQTEDGAEMINWLHKAVDVYQSVRPDRDVITYVDVHLGLGRCYEMFSNQDAATGTERLKQAHNEFKTAAEKRTYRAYSELARFCERMADRNSETRNDWIQEAEHARSAAEARLHHKETDQAITFIEEEAQEWKSLRELTD